VRPEQVALWVGEQRFQRYLNARGGQHERAVGLYIWNARISAAFLEVLCHLEVLLRNAIDRQFSPTPPAASLSILEPQVWLCDPSILTSESREKVNEAIARLQSEGKHPTRGRVITSLSFGFWQALFSAVYEDLWRSTLFKAFPNGSGARREIASLAGSILHFRNRIAHHEAIFFSDLKARHGQILRLARAIDGDAARYIEEVSSVEALLSGRP
jgi:hypothetical protein